MIQYIKQEKLDDQTECTIWQVGLSSICSHSQWRSKDVRGQWTTDSPGPLSILHNLIPLTPPPHTLLLIPCTCLSLLWFKSALFNQYTSHGVFWKHGSLWWRNGEVGAMGKWGLLDDAMINGSPWERDGKLEVIILMTWWGNWGPLMAQCSGKFRALCPLMTQWGNCKHLIKLWGNCGELNDLMRKTGNWAPDDAMEH